MSAEELLTPAAGIQVEENTQEQSKEVEPEDKKGLMDEIMEVISRGSASEEERQSTPGAVERPADQEEHQADDAVTANEEVEKSAEEELAEAKEDDDTTATQEAREPPPAEEEPQAAGEEGEKGSAQADTVASTDAAAGEDPAPVAAEEEPKVQDEAKVQDGEGEIEPSADKPAEPEDVVTSPPVDVTTSYLISTEDALAKGIAEEDVERFKQYHLKTRFGVQSWYQSLKEHTFETEFINLTKKQVEVLAAAAHPFSDAPELSEEQREVLSKLEEEIDAALEKFGDAGAFIKLDTCSGKDSVLDRNDADHIQEMKDSVVNEMEIEKQFANAYLIWRSWRSSSFRRSSTSNTSEAQEGRLRRSFRRIQKTFNRPRAQTTTLQTTPASKEKETPKNEDALAEETPKHEEEEKKEEEVKEDKPEAEADKSEGTKDEGETKEEGEGAKSEDEPAAITVEATIETEVEPKETQPAEAVAVEQKVDEEEKREEEASPSAQDIAPAADEKKEEVAAEPQPKEEKEIEVQEEKKEETKEENGVEETPAEKSEENDKKEISKEKKKPRSVKEKGKPVSEEHASVKVKEEPTQNKVLRALMSATTEKYHITTGKQAVEMLLTSARIKEELTLMHTFGEHLEDYQVVLSVRRWNEQLPRYPGMQFRGFVYKKRLTALSQYDDMVYIPNIIRFKNTIQKKILSFFNAHIKRAIDHDNYLIDIFVAPNQVYLIKLSPFHISSGACLFTWREHKELLTTTSRSIKFSVVSSPKPNCFSGLQSWWQSPLETVVQEHKKIEEPQHGQRCSIL